MGTGVVGAASAPAASLAVVEQHLGPDTALVLMDGPVLERSMKLWLASIITAQVK